ncbi:hypothetical protein AAVH_32270, partial [Aphelenchoides avenae]
LLQEALRRFYLVNADWMLVLDADADVVDPDYSVECGSTIGWASSSTSGSSTGDRKWELSSPKRRVRAEHPANMGGLAVHSNT